MKRLLLYIGILFSAFSCGSEPFRPAAGDLFFQINEASAMTDAITVSTAGNEPLKFSHVAICLGPAKADSIIEASGEGGVRIVSLSDFLDASGRIGGRPAVVVMRMRDTTGIAAGAAARSLNYLGQPYDYSYLPDNGKMYCSEMIRQSYLDARCRKIFPARPMNFRDSAGRLPEFWQTLFEKLGEPIPEGVLGTNPSDLAKDTLLYEIYRYFR